MRNLGIELHAQPVPVVFKLMERPDLCRKTVEVLESNRIESSSRKAKSAGAEVLRRCSLRAYRGKRIEVKLLRWVPRTCINN